MRKMLLFSIVLIIGTAWGQNCTADDGTEGVELWGECYSIQNTTQLDLENNQLTGVIPSEIGNLTNLTDLRLYGNQLTGAIPSEIGNLTNLTYLNLRNNELTEEIPPEIGNLTNLTDLRLYGNQLTGAIPSEIGNLTNLIYLDLSNNQLTGSIPTEIGNLTNLTYLVLGRNELTEEIPDRWDWSSSIGFLSEKFTFSAIEFSVLYNVNKHSEFYGSIGSFFAINGISSGFKYYFKNKSTPSNFISLGTQIITASSGHQNITAYGISISPGQKMEYNGKLYNLGISFIYFHDNSFGAIPFINVERRF